MSADAHEKPDIFVPADVVADPNDANAAIGESHHLAMTAPPELWTRVIVVQWAELLVRTAEREWVIPDMKACGQALEYLLHCHFRPTINRYARTTDRLLKALGAAQPNPQYARGMIWREEG
jgi:hypothetical protein